MPHLTLEYSDNLPAGLDLRGILERLNRVVAAEEAFLLTEVKGRAVPHGIFVVGAGDPKAVFVHLTVAILSGREVELRQRLSRQLLGTLREEFSLAYAERPCDLTVEIREMERASYAKAMNERSTSSEERAP